MLRVLGVQTFQPTLPARGATSLALKRSPLRTFQPTLPARGATNGRVAISDGRSDFNPRSPHGERLYPIAFDDDGNLFQPTLPARGATTAGRGRHGAGAISTHAPRTGSDQGVGDPPGASGISTHAPRTGSDIWARRTGTRSTYFNPRSPHGERPPAHLPAHPVRLISTHAPRTGSDVPGRHP